MTDFIAVTFLVSLAVIFMVASIIMKNTFMAMASGLCWALSSIYLFSRYYSGDADYGITVYGFAWVCALCTFGILFQSWWIHRPKTIAMTGQSDSFYSQDEFKEINDMYKARADRNALKGRRRG
jgi:hypothetical protein